MNRSFIFVACLAFIAVAHAKGCRDLDAASCTTDVDCKLCRMDIPWAKVAFCTSDESAAKLPAGKNHVFFCIMSILKPQF